MEESVNSITATDENVLSKTSKMQHTSSNVVIVEPSKTVPLSRKGLQRKAPDLPTLERRNWLIHLHFTRKEYETCKIIIKEQLDETQGMCEYAVYIQALILRHEGKIQESLELFQTCSILNTSAENLKQVARSLFLLGRHKNALDVYEEAVRMNCKDWELYHNLGICFMKLNNNKRAIEYFRQALQARPQDETFVALGHLYMLEGDVKSAISTYRTAVDHSPENPDLASRLGLLYLQCEMYQKAFEKLGAAIAFDSSCVPAILAAGSIIQNHSDYEVALSKYRIAISKVPESPALWNNIGMCFFGKKKYVAAISCLKRATYLAPFSSRILQNLGLVHLTMQQYASAFQFLSASMNFNSHSGQLYALLAVALKYLEDFKNSCHAYEQALKLDEIDPVIALNYALLLYEMKDSGKAVDMMKEFQKRCDDVSFENEKIKLKSIIFLAEKLAILLQIQTFPFLQSKNESGDSIEKEITKLGEDSELDKSNSFEQKEMLV